MILAEWSSLATIISAPIAAFALVFAGIQLRRTLAVERGRFMLEIERMLASSDATHLRLRPGGEWCDSGRGPETIEQWGQVEDYMGLFEHCEILIQSGLVNAHIFDRMFGYRVSNILNNPVIVGEKLVKEKDGWVDFLSLVQRLRLTVPAPI
jgi:hypothetical protein